MLFVHTNVFLTLLLFLLLLLTLDLRSSPGISLLLLFLAVGTADARLLPGLDSGSVILCLGSVVYDPLVFGRTGTRVRASTLLALDLGDLPRFRRPGSRAARSRPSKDDAFDNLVGYVL